MVVAVWVRHRLIIDRRSWELRRCAHPWRAPKARVPSAVSALRPVVLAVAQGVWLGKEISRTRQPLSVRNGPWGSPGGRLA